MSVDISQEAAEALLIACQRFVAKVERGEARSVRSYAEMREAIRLAKISVPTVEFHFPSLILGGMIGAAVALAFVVWARIFGWL